MENIRISILQMQRVNSILSQLGFTNTRFFQDSPNVVQSVDQNPLLGYVIANGIVANGRLLGLVFSGETITEMETIFLWITRSSIKASMQSW